MSLKVYNNEIEKNDYLENLINLTNLDFKVKHGNIIKYSNSELKINKEDITLYKIDEIGYYEEEKYPRREAFENVISSISLNPNLNVVYIIDGDGINISFYIGLVADKYVIDDFDTLESSRVIKSNFIANFKGSKLINLDNTEKEIEILEKIKSYNYAALINGIPSIMDTKDNKDFQGIDRLVNALQNEKFTISIVIKKHSDNSILELEKNLYDLYDGLSSYKKSFQLSKNNSFSNSNNLSETSGENQSESKTKSEGENQTTTKGKTIGISHNESKSEGENWSETTGNSNSETKGNNSNETIGYSNSNSLAISPNKSNNYNDISTTNNTKTQTEGKNSSITKGTSDSKTEGSSRSTSNGKTENKTESNGTSESNNESNSIGTNKSESKTESSGHNFSKTNGISTTLNFGDSTSVTLQNCDKRKEESLKYIDEILIPMIEYSKGKGLFSVQVSIFASERDSLLNTANNLKALASGNKSNKNALSIYEVNKNENIDILSNIKNLQMIRFEDINYNDKMSKMSLAYNSKMTEYNTSYFSNCYTSAQIALIAGLPQREVVGLKIKKQVEFGLNIPVISTISNDDKIVIGKLVQNDIPVEKSIILNRKDFDKHIFIGGVTGTGKTTTCQKLLKEAKYPFLVIEPAKTEYRGMKDTVEGFEELLVFTLGDEEVAPFRLNPFEIMPEDPEYGIRRESIAQRIDSIKAAVFASFNMEAAIPQVIEDIFYEAYRKKGWNVETNEYNGLENPFSDNVNSFPTFVDVLDCVENVVSKYDFDERLKKDYIGSIKSRLKTFTQGIKGQMFSCNKGLNFEDILERKVVFEIENIRNGQEKSFIIGLILININEALRRKYKKNKGFRHITLIEEAHRLLSKPETENQKIGVEMFTDMLAEVRKYGESLIIVDQIPSKLTPEVLKNTNTKIVHKLFAEDDKKIIGNTMSFNEEQSKFLSNLNVGRTIVFSQGWDSPIQVQISKINTIKDESEINDYDLRKNIINYYSRYSRKSIEYIDLFNMDVERAIQYKKDLSDAIYKFKEVISILDNELYKTYENLNFKSKILFKYLEKYKDIIDKFIFDIVKNSYNTSEEKQLNLIFDLMKNYVLTDIKFFENDFKNMNNEERKKQIKEKIKLYIEKNSINFKDSNIYYYFGTGIKS